MSYLPSNYDYFDIPRHMERNRLEAYDALLAERAMLHDALAKAADTFRDLIFVLQLVGRPVSAQACEIAMQGCQEVLGRHRALAAAEDQASGESQLSGALAQNLAKPSI